MNTLDKKELINCLRFYSPTLGSDSNGNGSGLPLAVAEALTACTRALAEALRVNEGDGTFKRDSTPERIITNKLTADRGEGGVPSFSNESVLTRTDPQTNFQKSEKTPSQPNKPTKVADKDFDVWLKRAEELLFPKKAIYMAHTSLVNPTPPTGKLELVPTDADIKRHNEDTYLDDIASNICPLDHGFMMENVLTDVERLAVNYQLAFLDKKIGRTTPRFNELKQQMLDIT